MSASDHSLTVLGNGKVVASGFNNYAQCGVSDGGLEPTDCPQGPEANVRAPAMVTHAELSASHVIASAEGGWHSLLIAEKFDQRPGRGASATSGIARVSPGEHVIWSVGRNARGQCGCSTNTPAITSPRKIAFFEGKGLRVNQIQAGGHYTVVMMDKVDADVDAELGKNAAEKAAREESTKSVGDHLPTPSPKTKRRRREDRITGAPDEASSEDAVMLSAPQLTDLTDGAVSSAGAGQVSFSWSASAAAAPAASEGAEHAEADQFAEHFSPDQFMVQAEMDAAAEPPAPPGAVQSTAGGPPAAPHIVRRPRPPWIEAEEDEIGQLYVFGSHKHGQLGLGRDSSSSPGHCNTPTRLRIPGLPGRRIRNIACGESHTIVVGVEGELFIWGWNNHGQLGLGDFQNRSEPQRLKFNSHLRKMHVERRRQASGSRAKNKAKAVARAAIDDGAKEGSENGPAGSGVASAAACFGEDNGAGAGVAVGPGGAAAERRQIGLSSRTWSEATARGKHRRKPLPDRVFDFGNRVKHALRREGYEQELPAEYMLARTRMVACGTEHTLVLTDDDELYSFGRGDNGQLGFHDVDSSSGLKEALAGSTDKPMDQTTPRWLSSMSYRGLSHIACGGRFSFAVQVVGAKPAAEHAPAPGFAGTGGDPPRDLERGSVRVWGWGDNSRGQLGIGPTRPSFLHTPPNTDEDEDAHDDDNNLVPPKPRITKWISAECACCSRPNLISAEAERPTCESEHDRDQKCWEKHSAHEAFPEGTASTLDPETSPPWHMKMVWRPHVIRTLSCQSHGGGASIGGGRVRQIFPRWQSTFVLTTEDVVFGFGRNDYGQLGASHAHDAKSNVLAPVRLNMLSGKGVMLATGQGDANMDLMQSGMHAGDDAEIDDDNGAQLDVGGEGGSYSWFRWFAGLTAANERCSDGAHVAEMSAREAPVLALHHYGSHTRHGLGRKLLRLGRRCHEFDSTSVDLGTLLIQANARGGDFGDCSDVRKYRWTPCVLFGAGEDDCGATETAADAIGWADAVLIAGRDRSRFAVHRAVIESRCPAFAALLRRALLRRGDYAVGTSGAEASVGGKRARSPACTLVRLDNCTPHDSDTSTSKSAEELAIEDSASTAPPCKRQRAGQIADGSKFRSEVQSTGGKSGSHPVCATIDGIDGYQLSALLLYIYTGRLWPLPNVQCEEDFHPISVPPIDDCDDPAQLIAHERAKKREYAASKIRPFQWALDLALAADRFNLADLSIAVRDRLKSSITVHSAIFLVCALSNTNFQAQSLSTVTTQSATTHDGRTPGVAGESGRHFNELKIAFYGFLRQRWKSVVAANPTLLAEVFGAVDDPGLLGEVFALSSAHSNEDAFRQIGITLEPRRPPSRTNRHPLHVDVLGMLRRANPLDPRSALPEGCVDEHGWVAHYQDICDADAEETQQTQCQPDVTVQVGDHNFRCHSVILVSRSAFFASALRTAARQKDTCEDGELTIRLTHDPMPSKRVFMVFLQYLYSGATMSFAKQLDLPMALELEQLAPFFMLRTRHLTSMCLQVIRSGLTPASALTLMSAAPSLCRDDLKEAATEYVLRNASKFSAGRSDADFARFVSESPVVAGALLRKSLSALGAARDESKLSIAEAAVAKRKAAKVETELSATRTALQGTQEKLKKCLESPPGTAAIAGSAGLAAADEDKGQDTSAATADGQSRAVNGASACRADLVQVQDPSSPTQPHQLDAMAQNEQATPPPLPLGPPSSPAAAPVIEDSTNNAQS